MTKAVVLALAVLLPAIAGGLASASVDSLGAVSAIGQDAPGTPPAGNA